EAKPEQFDALHGLRPPLARLIPVSQSGLGHDRLSPGPLEQPGLARLVRRDVRQRTRRPAGPALEPSGDASDDAIEEGADARPPAGLDGLQHAALAEALDEHLLRGVVEVFLQRRAAPAGGEVTPDDAEVATGHLLPLRRAARRRGPDDGPTGCFGG